jgi:hypothetical protein
MIQMPAATKKGGMANTFPDVCKTPAPPAPSPVPIPYPNIVQLNGADGTSKKVLMENKETITESSKVPRSSGDEAGVAKGLVSSTNMDKCTFKKYSSKVYAQGKKIVHHTAVTAHNGSNANMPAGCHTAPSQTKVLVAM